MFGGTYLDKILPANTPTREEQTSARDAPIKTGHIDLFSATKSIVVIWVLSPNSATKTNKKVVITNFRIISPHPVNYVKQIAVGVM
jgi:hypothetical protein